MPWEVRQSGSADKPHCVHKKDTGESVACFPTKEAADAHLRALYAQVGPQEDLPQHDSREDGVTRRAFRLDSGRLAKAKRTPQGGIRADGTIAIAKVLEYRNTDGSIRREWFPESEAKREDSLATLEVAAVTMRHPREMVTARNYRDYNVGLIRAPRFADGAQHAEIVVQDAEQLDAIEADGAELSAGYHCDLVEKPGVTPDGEPYDAIQKNRVYNHVGIGPIGWARAGAGAALHLDGHDDLPLLDSDGNCRLDHAPTTRRPPRKDGNDPATPATGEIPMMKLMIDGVEVEMPEAAAEVVKKALEMRDAKLKEAAPAPAAPLDSKEALRRDAMEATLQARIDAQTGEIAELKTKLADATDPKKVQEAAQAVAKLDGDCRRLAPSVKLDGLSDPFAKMRAALTAARVEIPSDTDLQARGFDPATYVGSRFDAELARVPARRAAKDQLEAARAVVEEAPVERKDAYAEMRARRIRENANRPGQTPAHEEV